MGYVVYQSSDSISRTQITTSRPSSPAFFDEKVDRLRRYGGEVDLAGVTAGDAVTRLEVRDGDSADGLGGRDAVPGDERARLRLRLGLLANDTRTQSLSLSLSPFQAP